jgi:rhodanese-related sulfurtransferase
MMRREKRRLRAREQAMNREDDSELRIDVDQARAKLESGEAIALDVIQPAEWSRLHRAIKGAVRIPPLQIVHRFRELPQDCDIIAYCT